MQQQRLKYALAAQILNPGKVFHAQRLAKLFAVA